MKLWVAVVQLWHCPIQQKSSSSAPALGQSLDFECEEYKFFCVLNGAGEGSIVFLDGLLSHLGLNFVKTHTS